MPVRFLCCGLFVLLATIAAAQRLAHAQEPSADQLKFFEEKIRPVLVKHCYSCHSHDALAGKKLQAELFSIQPQGCSRAAKVVRQL